MPVGLGLVGLTGVIQPCAAPGLTEPPLSGSGVAVGRLWPIASSTKPFMLGLPTIVFHVILSRQNAHARHYGIQELPKSAQSSAARTPYESPMMGA